MKVTSKINRSHLNFMHQILQESQIKAVDAIKTDVQDSQTMPFDTGALQNNSMSIDDSEVRSGKVVLVHSGLPYPRRLYFHPEYNFHQEPWTSIEKGKEINHGANPKAGGMWFQPYIDGNKKKMPQIYFTKFVKEYMK